MSKNLVIGTKTYEGVSTVNFNTSDNGIAVFKDVDEMTSGSFDIPTEMTLLGTNNTGEDMSLNAFFTEHPLEVQMDNIYFFKLVGDTAPTKGKHTLRDMVIGWHVGRSNDVYPPANMAWVSHKYNLLVAPSSFASDGSGYNMENLNNAYVTRRNGHIDFNASLTNHYIPVGGSIYYAEYPISMATGLPHE